MKNNIFQQELDRLNEGQRQAVETIYGPVMVVAGPGTGKTQIIALRTANIITQTGCLPQNILITTFTEAGVVAIKKRLESFLGSDGYKVSVSTIHSFCQDVINTFPEKFLEFKAGTPVDDVDSLEILKHIMDEMISAGSIEKLTSDYNRFYYLRTIKSKISNLKQEGINHTEFKIKIKKQEEKYSEDLLEINEKKAPKKYAKFIEDSKKHIQKLEELALIFEKYQEKLRELSKYDFNDMINFVLDKFKIDSDLRYYYAEKFQFIMLDEFQDTNNSQNTIIDLILSTQTDANSQNIMIVGDDDQSIYRFQGANIENMLNFSIKYPDLTTVVLKNNYRSNQAILDLCTESINNNEQRLTNRISSLEKELISSHPDYKEDKNKPIFATFNTQKEEQTFLVESIKSDIQNIPLEEIAIIVRSNKEVEELSNLLQQNQIDVISKQNTNIFKNYFVDLILKILYFLDDPFNSEREIIDILRSDIFGIPQVDIFRLNNYLYRENYKRKFKIGVYETILEIEKLEENFLDINSIINFKNIINNLEISKSEKNIKEFFNDLLKEINLIEYVQTNGTFDDIQDIYTLFNKINGFYVNQEEFDLKDLISKIELFKEYNIGIARQILKKQGNGVQILTAHSSKGLEFEKVYVSGVYNGNWDGKKSRDLLKLPVGIAGSGLQEEVVDPIEEERRLFFVACSRAKRELVITTPLSKENKILLVSTFTKEIENLVENKAFSISEEQISQTIKNELENNKIIYTHQEFDYIEEFLENYKLSPTDLNTFIEDPKEFLNRAVFKYPFIDNNATIFGNVYHRVLELFYSKFKNEGKLPKSGYLTGTFKLLLEKEKLDPESFEMLLEKGTKGLEGFYEEYKTNSRPVVFLEYNFRPKGLIYRGIPVTGKIDKIEVIGGLSNNVGDDFEGQLAFFKEKVALIDYKTGRAKTENNIKGLDRNGNKKPGEGKYFRQVLFYKLLCELDSEFMSKYEIDSLAIDFVEGRDGKYNYVNVSYTQEDYNDFLEELTDSREKIKNINFWKEILKK